MWLMSNVNPLTTYETTEGVVVELIREIDTDGDYLYRPVYEYQVDGTVYRYPSRVSYGGFAVPDIGDQRTMLYNPEDPNDVTVRNIFILIWLPIILMVIPVVGIVAVFWSMRRRSKVSDQAPPWGGQAPTTHPDWAQQPPVSPSWGPPAGDRESIEATFMGTEPSQMDAEGKVRYRVKARAELDGEIHRFRSEWVDEDPTLYYMEHGNKVEVRIDPNDPSSYEVVLPPIE
jgi:hypothetical protein